MYIASRKLSQIQKTAQELNDMKTKDPKGICIPIQADLGTFTCSAQ